MRQIYQEGATIAGTSSGASVMTEVMIAGSEGNSSSEVGGEFHLAPGLGLISGVIIDQHFAERAVWVGCLARSPTIRGCLASVSMEHGPRFEGHQRAGVIGSGAVYVVDGRDITYTNTAEDQKQTRSIFGVKLHVLSHGDIFDLTNRAPVEGEPDQLEQKLIH